jgi:AcrR family transcriptional regulator
MSKDDRAFEDEETRERILDAARRCLSAKNFHNVTMDDISRASLVPRRIIRRHFPNRDVLLNAAVQRGVQQILALVSRSMDEGQGSVRHLIDLMMPLLTGPAAFDIGRFNVEWWAWALRNEVALRDIQGTWEQWHDQLGVIISSEFEGGLHDQDQQAMAVLMLALFNGLLLHATSEAGQLDMARIARLQQFAWDGIIERVRAGGLSDLSVPPKTGRRAR